MAKGRDRGSRNILATAVASMLPSKAEQQQEAPKVEDAPKPAEQPPQPPTQTDAGVELTAIPKTKEEAMSATRDSLLKVYGSKSNAIRGMVNDLGIKVGDVAKKLDIIYQHARNVSRRPLKRKIAEEREAQRKGQAQSQGGNETSEG